MAGVEVSPDERKGHSAPRGHRAVMSSPIDSTGLAATANESAEESVRKEREAVGDHPDTGALVSQDVAQSDPDVE